MSGICSNSSNVGIQLLCSNLNERTRSHPHALTRTLLPKACVHFTSPFQIHKVHEEEQALAIEAEEYDRADYLNNTIENINQGPSSSIDSIFHAYERLCEEIAFVNYYFVLAEITKLGSNGEEETLFGIKLICLTNRLNLGRCICPCVQLSDKSMLPSGASSKRGDYANEAVAYTHSCMDAFAAFLEEQKCELEEVKRPLVKNIMGYNTSLVLSQLCAHSFAVLYCREISA